MKKSIKQSQKIIEAAEQKAAEILAKAKKRAEMIYHEAVMEQSRLDEMKDARQQARKTINRGMTACATLETLLNDIEELEEEKKCLENKIEALTEFLEPPGLPN